MITVAYIKELWPYADEAMLPKYISHIKEGENNCLIFPPNSFWFGSGSYSPFKLSIKWNNKRDTEHKIVTTCGTKKCINPNHLRETTHCVNGHEHNDQNTYINKSGIRMCRQCRNDRMNKYREAYIPPKDTLKFHQVRQPRGTYKKYPSEYRCWTAMLRRCLDAKEFNYKNYGGKGITVCPQWQESFIQFYDDVGPRPGPDYSLDRIDNNGNYEPGNVRWSTREQQMANFSRNHYIEYNGERKTLQEWADSIGVNRSQIYERIYTLGWTVEKALTTKSK